MASFTYFTLYTQFWVGWLMTKFWLVSFLKLYMFSYLGQETNKAWPRPYRKFENEAERTLLKMRLNYFIFCKRG